MDNDGLQEGSQRKEARQLHSLYCVLCRWFACNLFGWGWFLASDASSISQDPSAAGPASDSHRIFLAAT